MLGGSVPRDRSDSSTDCAFTPSAFDHRSRAHLDGGVAAAQMLAIDEDVGHGLLAGALHQRLLHVGAILCNRSRESDYCGDRCTGRQTLRRLSPANERELKADDRARFCRYTGTQLVVFTIGQVLLLWSTNALH